MTRSSLQQSVKRTEFNITQFPLKNASSIIQQ